MSDTTIQLQTPPVVARPAHPLPATPSRIARLVSAQSVLVALSLVVGLVAVGSSLLGDPDTQWHIAVGRQIWAAGAVPSTDLYSHTFAGAPWIAKEWLSQLILFAADEALGWRGVVFVTALAIAAAFAVMNEWLRRRLDPILVIALVCVSLMLAMPHMLARPHTLVLPIVVVWLAGILGAVERGRPPHAAFALVMALWANMHGSFPLGLVLAGLLALESVVAAPTATRIGLLLRWALFLILALAATMLSPYGGQALLVPLRMEGNAETLKYVQEWKPLTFDVTGCLALAVLAASLLAQLRGLRTNVARIAIFALLGAMMVRHVRFVSLFGVLAPLLVAHALARWPRLVARLVEEPAVLWGVNAALAAGSLAALAIVSPLPSDEMTPEAAYQSARAAGVRGPVYNDYDFGGYLIAHGVKTFVDGRTDQLFLGDFIPGLMRAMNDKHDDAFAALLAKYDVGWALVRTGKKEAGHLVRMPGWTRVHEDKVASVYVRR